MKLFWAVLAFAGCLSSTSFVSAQFKAAGAGNSEKELALGSIYTTTGQKGLRQLTCDFTLLPKDKKRYKEAYGFSLDVLLNQYRSGASDLLIVPGENIGQAIDAAQWRLMGERMPKDSPGTNKKDKANKENQWLVVYLGFGPREEPRWLLESVRIREDRVTCTFKQNESKSDDLVPYLFWVPLGARDIGNLTLELFDSTANELKLSRSAPLLVSQQKQTDSKIEIPVESIYATAGYAVGEQKGLKGIRPRGTTESGVLLAELCAKYRAHSANIFLVAEDNITSAVRATRLVLLDRQGIDSPPSVHKGPAQPKDFWLVVHLEDGGNGNRYLIKSVERKNQVISFIFSERKKSEASLPIAAKHYYWVPLGHLEPGSYILELFNTDKNQADLSRRISIR